MHTGAPTGARHLVKLRRQEKGLSARGLSLAAGQSPSYVTKLEAGTIEPSLRAFARIAGVLGLSAAEVWAVMACEGGR